MSASDIHPGSNAGMLPVTLVIVGKPLAQPRPRATTVAGHAAISGQDDSRPWKALVIDAATKANIAGLRITAPLDVSCAFRLARPKGHFGTGRNAGNLKPHSPSMHTSRPDIDNLFKAVLDALSDCGVWSDDALVWYCELQKRFCGVNESPGCTVTIRRTAAGGGGE